MIGMCQNVSGFVLWLLLCYVILWFQQASYLSLIHTYTQSLTHNDRTRHKAKDIKHWKKTRTKRVVLRHT